MAGLVPGDGGSGGGSGRVGPAEGGPAAGQGGRSALPDPSSDMDRVLLGKTKDLKEWQVRMSP